MRKICVVTGTRAEYGLLYWLMRGIADDPDLQLQVIVTGMHLSPEFGLTYREIEHEFRIDKKIEMLLSSDSATGISKSMGLAQISFAEAYTELEPDILVLLGDRYEILAAANAALVARIPIAHLHGGETTEGAYDEAIRHSLTKMSSLHFTAAETYRKRVIQLGEHPERVFTVGGMGIENICRLKLLNKDEIEASLGMQFGTRNLLVTFHPETLGDDSSERLFSTVLQALSCLKDTRIIFTKANADTDGRIINSMIDDYIAQHPATTVAFTSLGQLRYLSTLRFVDAVVGNSSSGLAEAPSFHVGTINIGQRQKGRLRASSVIDCEADLSSLEQAFRKLYSERFQRMLTTVKNPYGTGCASAKIISVLKTWRLDALQQKRFYDIEFSVQ